MTEDLADADLVIKGRGRGHQVGLSVDQFIMDILRPAEIVAIGVVFRVAKG